jgi:hypothetical protein
MTTSPIAKGWRYQGPALLPFPPVSGPKDPPHLTHPPVEIRRYASRSTTYRGFMGPSTLRAEDFGPSRGVDIRHAEADRPSAIAIHESCHAVVAARVGVAIDRAWINNGRGQVEYARTDYDRDYDRRDLTRLTTLCAGRIGTDLAGMSVDDGQDWADALTIMRSRYDGNHLLAEAKIAARTIITGNWAAVEDIARRLDRFGELDGREIRAIVDTHRVGDLASLEASPELPPSNTTPNPSTKTVGEVARLKKQKQTGSKAINGTDDVAALDGGEDLPAEDSEDDVNLLEDDEEALAAKAAKKTDVLAGGRIIGNVYYMRDGRFIAVRVRGRRRTRLGRVFRSSDGAARAV